MNEVKGPSFVERIKNAIRAFKCKPVEKLYLGIDVKRCSECDYKENGLIRYNFLVTAGARAAYMDFQGVIDIPKGLDGEDELAYFVGKIVDYYFNELVDVNFDEYIESRLIEEYGKETDIHE